MEYHTWRVTARAMLCRCLGRSDYSRWTDASTFASEWNERSFLIAKMIPPGSRVLDVGAGRQQLRKYISPDSSYTAADLVARDADTLVIDLNARHLPMLGQDDFNVAILAGVIEYVSNVGALLDWLSNNFVLCIVSYGCAKDLKGFAKLRQSWRRAGCGWVNSLTEKDLRDKFEESGYQLITTRDWKTDEGDERIFLFRKIGASNWQALGASNELTERARRGAPVPSHSD